MSSKEPESVVWIMWHIDGISSEPHWDALRAFTTEQAARDEAAHYSEKLMGKTRVSRLCVEAP